MKKKKIVFTNTKKYKVYFYKINRCIEIETCSFFIENIYIDPKMEEKSKLLTARAQLMKKHNILFNENNHRFKFKEIK